MKKLTLKESYEFYEFYKSNSNEEVMNKYILFQKDFNKILNNYELNNLIVNILFMMNIMFLFMVSDISDKLNKLTNEPTLTLLSFAFLTTSLISYIFKNKNHKIFFVITGIVFVSIISAVIIFNNSFKEVILFTLIILVINLYPVIYVFKTKKYLKPEFSSFILISFYLTLNSFVKPQGYLLLIHLIFILFTNIFSKYILNYEREKKLL